MIRAPMRPDLYCPMDGVRTYYKRGGGGGAVPMSVVLRWAVAVIIGFGLVTTVPAAAFDDADFCTAARQLAVAADRDVGVWLDRKTRNAGIDVSCERKRVEFRQFTYSPASSMDGAWKANKGAEWSGMQCASPLWRQAIHNNWKVALSVTAVDGANVVLDAECK